MLLGANFRVLTCQNSWILVDFLKILKVLYLMHLKYTTNTQFEQHSRKKGTTLFRALLLGVRLKSYTGLLRRDMKMVRVGFINSIADRQNVMNE